MPNDTTIQPVIVSHVGGDIASETRRPQPGPPPSQADVTSSASPMANPTLRLNAALGLVVIEFRDSRGAVTTTIPSEQQLAAYQKWDATRFGPAPPGRADDAAAPRPPAPSTAGLPARSAVGEPGSAGNVPRRPSGPARPGIAKHQA